MQDYLKYKMQRSNNLCEVMCALGFQGLFEGNYVDTITQILNNCTINHETGKFTTDNLFDGIEISRRRRSLDGDAKLKELRRLRVQVEGACASTKTIVEGIEQNQSHWWPKKKNFMSNLLLGIGGSVVGFSLALPVCYAVYLKYGR